MASLLTPTQYPRFNVYADGNNLKNLAITFFCFDTRLVKNFNFVFSPKAENGLKTALLFVIDMDTNVSYNVNYDSTTDIYYIDSLFGINSIVIVGNYIYLYFDVSSYSILDILRTTTISTNARIYKLELFAGTTWDLAFSGLLNNSVDEKLSSIVDIATDIRGSLSTLMTVYCPKGVF